MEPCKYFAKGSCARGTACRFSHTTVPAGLRVNSRTTDVAFATAHGRAPQSFSPLHQPTEKPKSKLRPAADEFRPRFGAETGSSSLEAVSITPTKHTANASTQDLVIDQGFEMPICRFFAQGVCKNGMSCKYRHVTSCLPLEDEGIKNSMEELSLDACYRSLQGANVEFGPGAAVSNVKLAVDFSTVQISRLPANCKPETIQGLLTSLGFSVALACIRQKALDNCVVAEVKVEDPAFSKKLVQRFHEELGRGNQEDITIKSLQVGNASGSSVNRLQMSSVSCSWYKASKVAYLHYGSLGAAQEAQWTLSSQGRILGRKLQCKIQRPEIHVRPTPSRPLIYSIRVGNLDPLTTKNDFSRILRGAPNPTNIVFGEASHTLTETAAEKVVAELLYKRDMESWEPIPTYGATRAKAIARFDSREKASLAVRELNNTKISALGNSRLFLQQMTSVKFSVLTDMFNAVEGEIGDLEKQLLESGHVHLKSYPPAQPLRKYVVLRVYGEETKKVAEAKSMVERILAGTVAEQNGSNIWHPIFLTAQGLAHLKQLHEQHQVYIHRDAQKLRLAMYGSESNKKQAQASVIQKVRALSQLVHNIELSPELLRRALGGGWRRIRERFGKEGASLEIVSTPKKIIIRGSQHDLEEAQALLLAEQTDESGQDSNSTQATCAVCWTEAIDPYTTTCKHVYCTDCFCSLCKSAGDSGLPVRCFGDKGKCETTLAIRDLQKVLPSSAFENLLEASFTAYIRTNPASFQYCPTPDCPQIYRHSASAASTSFDCPSCLASVCTSCNVISHDGLTCAEYKDLVSDGMQAFERYKREHHVKDCPQCKTPIEKTYGCNHMECKGCSAHICWSCMKTFKESGECYAHMQDEHGSYGQAYDRI